MIQKLVRIEVSTIFFIYFSFCKWIEASVDHSQLEGLNDFIFFHMVEVKVKLNGFNRTKLRNIAAPISWSGPAGFVQRHQSQLPTSSHILHPTFTLLSSDASAQNTLKSPVT